MSIPFLETQVNPSSVAPPPLREIGRPPRDPGRSGPYDDEPRGNGETNKVYGSPSLDLGNESQGTRFQSDHHDPSAVQINSLLLH